MRSVLILLVLLFSQINLAKEFSFHVNFEPSRLNPYYLDKITGHYVLSNMFKGYLRIDKDLLLEPSLAKGCLWKTKLHLVCEMNDNKWSNGTQIPLTAYLSSLNYHRKKMPESSVSQALLNVKSDGISLEKPNKIHFKFEKPDADFLYRIASPAFSPLPKGLTKNEDIAINYATGPYKLKKWARGRHLLLERNEHYPIEIKNPPTVKVYFIAEDNTALSLFEQNRISFLRKLPPQAEEVYKDKKEFGYIQGLRFDYLGFGGELLDKQFLRKRLTQSLNYEEFKKIFKSLVRPGCFGLPAEFSNFNKCYEFKLKDQKGEILNKKPYDLYFAHIGGENLQRSIEWIHNQWKKNARIDFSLKQEDVKVLGARLKENPPHVFRRGVPLDRPTCLAAIETFHSDTPDNFIRFKKPSFDKLVEQLRENPYLTLTEKKSLCTKALGILFDSRRLIPLGSFQIPYVKSLDFEGYTINGLNQLDLSNLKIAK